MFFPVNYTIKDSIVGISQPCLTTDLGRYFSPKSWPDRRQLSSGAIAVRYGGFRKNGTPKSSTLWLFNIAMENGPFIDDFPIKTSIYEGFSMAMLNNQMVFIDGIFPYHPAIGYHMVP